MNNNEVKLSKRTLEILKNLGTIHSHLFVPVGNKISTISPAKNIVAITNIPENFPVEFGIFDMQMLLGAFSLFENLKIELNDNFMTITEEGGAKGTPTIKFYYAALNTLTSIPSKEPSFPTEDNITFNLTNTDIEKIKRASTTLGHNTVVFSNKNGKLKVMVINVDKSGFASKTLKNSFSFDLCDTGIDDECSAIILIENLKLLKSDYKVTICPQYISKFSSVSDDITYYIANVPKKLSEIGI